MSTTLYLQETFVNRTEGYIFGEGDVYETFTDDKGELYRELQREYGRCTGKVYIDTNEGTKAIGWVFVKRDKYTDSNDTYLREVWCTVHSDKPSTVYHYA